MVLNFQKKVLFVIFSLMTIAAISSAYWGPNPPTSTEGMIFGWIGFPILGFTQVVLYCAEKRMVLGLIGADPNEVEKRVLILALAALFIICPIIAVCT
jgi:hypothetical protein